jgi:hypothetical protein
MYLRCDLLVNKKCNNLILILIGLNGCKNVDLICASSTWYEQ